MSMSGPRVHLLNVLRAILGTKMTEAGYPPPVGKLLLYGESRMDDWPDYLALGLAPEHIPDLIRMALDEQLHWADSNSPEVWAPVHVWRALGQLHAEAAAEPLAALFRRIDEDNDDWVGEELPEVYGMIGPAALPVLAAYLADPAHPLYARIAAARSLQEVAGAHPAARDECVALLTRQLERFAENDPTLNGFLIAPLLDLKAVESAPMMERAFAAGEVDEAIAGDWEDVQVDLGLLDARVTPKPPSRLVRTLFGEADLETIEQIESLQPARGQLHAERQIKAKVKAKRKQADKMRKKSRRKKKK